MLTDSSATPFAIAIPGSVHRVAQRIQQLNLAVRRIAGTQQLPGRPIEHDDAGIGGQHSGIVFEHASERS